MKKIYSSRIRFHRLQGGVATVKITEGFIYTVIIVMEECRAVWKITAFELAELIEKYDLVNELANGYEYYNSMGIRGIVNELECIIKKVRI